MLNAHRRFFPDLLLLAHENIISVRGQIEANNPGFHRLC